MGCIPREPKLPTHKHEDGIVYYKTKQSYDTETDELSRFLVAKQFLYLLDH